MSPLRGRVKRIVEFCRAVGERADKHDADITAAGLSFYALLGLFPSLLALVSIYGLVADPADVEAALVALAQALPPQARRVVIEGLTAFVERSSNDLTFSIVFSLAAVLWSSSSGMGVLVHRINVAYGATERRSFFARRAFALCLTLAAVVAVAVVVPALTAIPRVLAALHAENFLVLVAPLALGTAAFLALVTLFRYAPYRQDLRFGDVAPGAAAASLSWVVMTGLYTFYLRFFARLSSTYGALEGVIVLLLWFYLSAIVLLYAVELNVEVARLRDGARRSSGGSGTPRLEASAFRR